MTILGIETSCDETGAAVLSTSNNRLTLLANSLSSSIALHSTTGGIIPEVAAREQLRYIIPVIREALKKGLSYDLGSPKPPPLDAIAVTYGPGLIGSLLVGVETAKTLSLVWNKELIPINHLYGHIYANWLQHHTIYLPAIALVISGGHTDLVYLRQHNDITVIGGTRDDAAGEAFDKIGRLLNLPYPAGPAISHLAEKGNTHAFDLPRPMIRSHDFDFSFSGLKTAVLNLVKKNKWEFHDPKFVSNNKQILYDLCASVQQAIIDVVVIKTLKAAKKYRVRSILLGGGVAANKKLKEDLQMAVKENLQKTDLFIPPKEFCTDNGAMIAAAAVFTPFRSSWKSLSVDPELYY